MTLNHWVEGSIPSEVTISGLLIEAFYRKIAVRGFFVVDYDENYLTAFCRFV